MVSASKTILIVDTGPLVALFNQNDHANASCLDRFKEIKAPLITCEAVLAESLYLLQKLPLGPEKLLTLIERGIVEIEFSFKNEIRSIKQLMKKYSDTPMDFADACIVRMTELYTNSKVWTLDGDFQIYRRLGRRRIPLLFDLP